VKITVYPADSSGCGAFRLIWAAEQLRSEGHDVEVKPADKRDIALKISGNRRRDKDSHTEEVLGLEGTDVLVLQRITHQFMAEAVPILRRRGIAVVIDVDDDLSSIHPSNPAYSGYHPRNQWRIDRKSGEYSRNSWLHLKAACRDATTVTVSTPALLDIYATRGQGKVIYNHLPAHYFGVDHQDSDRIGWPASLVSHPDDPSALGGAMARLCADPGAFQVVGDPTGCGAAFGLARDPSGFINPISLLEWPHKIADNIGIGIAPLADTRFNRCKSWLKPLELSALGIPWVASPRDEYWRLHRKGCGVLADTPRRWHRELKRLQGSPALRAELSAAGREVADGFRLEPNAWRWLEAWHGAHDHEHNWNRKPVVIT
jgi:hypothetical protein